MNHEVQPYDEEMALRDAVIAANESPCRSQRGVVVWNDKGPIARGYNSPPQGLICDQSDACREHCAKTAVHAEQRALIYALLEIDIYSENVRDYQMIHVKSVDGKAVPSLRPSCVQCSKLILESGISYMWLLLEDGLKRYTAEEFHEESLKNNNIPVIK